MPTLEEEVREIVARAQVDRRRTGGGVVVTRWNRERRDLDTLAKLEPIDRPDRKGGLRIVLVGERPTAEEIASLDPLPLDKDGWPIRKGGGEGSPQPVEGQA